MNTESWDDQFSLNQNSSFENINMTDNDHIESILNENDNIQYSHQDCETTSHSSDSPYCFPHSPTNSSFQNPSDTHTTSLRHSIRNRTQPIWLDDYIISSKASYSIPKVNVSIAQLQGNPVHASSCKYNIHDFLHYQKF